MATNGEKSAPPLFVLHEHASSVLCCSFYPSSAYEREQSSWFLSGDVDGTVIVWNLLTRRPLIAFAAAEEARSRLRTRTRQPGEDAGEGRESISPSTSFAALGPHSRSVVSVGFVPTSAGPLGTPRKEGGASAPVSTTSVVPTKQPYAAGQYAVVGASGASAVQNSAGSLMGPQRQRFHLARRTVPRSSDAPPQASTAGNDGAPDGEAAADEPVVASSMCFYTHCRDQRVYVWSFSTSTMTLRLMAALTAPQHGFCPAESVSLVENATPKTFLAVPHDTNGEVTVWEMQWKAAAGASKLGLLSDEVRTTEASTAGGVSAEVKNSKPGDEGSGDEEEEVDVTGMSPMDALIARAAAQERRDAKKRSAESRENSPQHPLEGSGVELSLDAVVKRTERSSFLCFVAPFATAGKCGFSVRRLCTFSACPRFKGGTIMRLTLCSDAQHMTVAFESGHVVLLRFRADTPLEQGVNGRSAAERGLFAATGQSDYVPSVRCVVRAFAESALACWWRGRRVLACSAEGALHCYEIAALPNDGSSGDRPGTADAPFELQLLWSCALRKGIGSVCIQANLVIAGCWDSTLRLYDARDGRLVSILSYQREVINEVTVAPPAIARGAAFGFDARQPRCYAPQPARLQIAGSAGGLAGISGGIGEGRSEIASPESPAQESNALLAQEEELVYLFGSASKDGSVAVWRIDMQLVAEKAAMKLLTP